MKGQLSFFEAFTEMSKFYHKVVNPLLSMHTVNSIEVEQRVNTMKDTLLTKKQIHFADPKGVALFQGSESLKLIMKAKIILGKKVTDSLV